MQVAQGRIVAIEYQVTLADGEVVESTPDEGPVHYIQGNKTLLPALEAALEGVEEGRNKQFILQPDDAYGQRDETSVCTLPRSSFPEPLAVGSKMIARSAWGESFPMTVLEIKSDQVVVDLNHPLAGKALHFDVKVISVREAGIEEVFTGKPRPIEVV